MSCSTAGTWPCALTAFHCCKGEQKPSAAVTLPADSEHYNLPHTNTLLIPARQEGKMRQWRLLSASARLGISSLWSQSLVFEQSAWNFVLNLGEKLEFLKWLDNAVLETLFVHCGSENLRKNYWFYLNFLNLKVWN